MWHQMWGWDGGWGLGMGWGFGLMHVLWWTALVVGVVALFRWSSGVGRRPRVDSALQILRERYARGEIEKAEFDERASRLNG
ncbi:MAG: SHOCT domain-containing protein [Ramlibacter sp.]